MFHGGTASLTLSSKNAAILFDIQQGKKVAKITMPLVKYVVWITDSSLFALSNIVSVSELDLWRPLIICKAITIYTNNLSRSGLIHETIRTSNSHRCIRDTMVIRNLDNLIYFTRILPRLRTVSVTLQLEDRGRLPLTPRSIGSSSLYCATTTKCFISSRRLISSRKASLRICTRKPPRGL